MRFPHKVQGLHQRIYQSKRFTPKYEICIKVQNLFTLKYELHLCKSTRFTPKVQD